MLWQGNGHKRKVSGGKRKFSRGKRLYEVGGYPAETQIGGSSVVSARGRGGSAKQRILEEEYANVTEANARQTRRVKILSVIRNPVSMDYNRRKIITRGTLIETELGDASVTSRPGQDGVINALITGIQK